MRVEPTIDQSQLEAALVRSYGVQVRDLVYLPKGEVTYSYVLRAADNCQHILKLLDQSRLARVSARQLRLAFPLLRELRARKLLTNVPEPVFTLGGCPLATFEEYDLAMLVFVEGQNPDDETFRRPEIWAQLAGHVARLHTATSSVRTSGLSVEDYQLPFESELLDGVRELRQVSPSARPGIRRLQALLLPRSQEVFDILGRTKDLASAARSLAQPPVLCHTDIHAMNLLVNDRSALTLIDWEGIKLAPAEHDLFAFNGDDLPAFLSAYWRAGGRRQLDPEVFGFYFYRRNLEDLTDWLVRILRENSDPIQDDLDLAGMQFDCIDAWPYLDRGIECVRRQLTNLAS